MNTSVSEAEALAIAHSWIDAFLVSTFVELYMDGTRENFVLSLQTTYIQLSGIYTALMIVTVIVIGKH